MMRRRLIVMLVMPVLLCACASAPRPQVLGGTAAVPVNETTANPLAVYDPWSPFNRRMYHVNAWLDDYVLLPVVRGYRLATTQPVRTGVSNFFSNLGDITTFANAVVQLKPKEAAATLARLVINTTFGIGGLVDMATPLGLKQQHEDFGLTLAHYGVGAGPYLVLPFFGPSTLRDAFGLSVDRIGFYALDPLFLAHHPPPRWAYLGLLATNKRNDTKFRYYQTGSPFEYILVRFVYVNYRALQAAQ